jgi:hypothetical protein
LSKQIAYQYRENGADPSGWDLTQFLRIPYTYNFKPEYQQNGDQAPVVTITSMFHGFYRPEDFTAHEPVQEPTGGTDEPVPDLRGLPSVQELLDRSVVPERAVWLFYDFGENHKEGRSGALWELESLCREAGFTKEETFRVAWESAPNKYGQDGRPQSALWKEVLKNYDQHQEQLEDDSTDDSGFITLSTLEEESVSWLWHRRIPMGKIAFFEGDPEGAKSLLTTDIIARVATGRAIPLADAPGELEGSPRDVLVISAEDDLRDTIMPRLRAAGADISRVHITA